MKRTRRLLSGLAGFHWNRLLAASLLTSLAAMTLAAAQTADRAQSAKPEGTQQMASPYGKWLNEDVVYIITPEERGAFLKLRKDAERDHFIEQFWARRDPTPDTPENEFKEEHYRRIAYANERFGAKVPGWKTDRGRVYITFGPPDEIESHSSGEPAKGNAPAKSYAFEQWLYRYMDEIGTNVIVEFADPSRTGDYRMPENPTTDKIKKLVPTPGGVPYQQM